MGFTCDGANIKQLERHNIVYIHQNTDFKLFDLYVHNQNIVKAWATEHKPFIIARQHNIKKGITIALSTVKNGSKIKAAMTVDLADILIIQYPPTFNEISKYYNWDINILDSIESYVYGSYAISFLTKQVLFNDNSDIDILIKYNKQSLHFLENMLTKLQEYFNCKVDVEIRFENVGDINLKELLDSKSVDMICKTISSVDILLREELYELQPSLHG